MAEYDMPRVMAFLTELLPNNNKPWFEAHKAEFKTVQSIFNDFASELIDSIAAIDDEMAGLTLKNCTYRFYRDIRFSKDKTPYKNHFGVFICKGGKCSGRSGYYFHIEPRGAHFLGGGLLCTGAYCPEPFAVKSIREEFQFKGDEFVKNIKAAKDFSLSWDGALKNVPKGFSKDDPYSEYYKLKAVLLERQMTEEFLFAPDLVKRTVELFSETVPFNRQLNRAIDFGYEEYR